MFEIIPDWDILGHSTNFSEREVTLRMTNIKTQVFKLDELNPAEYNPRKKLKPGALQLFVGNGLPAAVEAIGDFNLVLPSGLLIVLDNCHYAPTITRGVIQFHF